MQITRVRILVVGFVCFFIGHTGFASSIVETEFEMLLPRSFQQNLIEQEWQALQKNEFKMNWVLPDQVYDTPDVKVLLSGLQLNLKTKLQKPAINPGGESLTLESKGLEADLNIQAVAIDQYIEREVGGVIGRFHIQARCEGVRLHMKAGKGAIVMKLSPVFEHSLLRAHVDDVDISWVADAWNPEDLKCTGAQGFDELIKAEVLKQTGDASIAIRQKATLMEYAQKYANEQSIDLGKPRNLTSTRPDIKVSMRITDFLGLEKNALALGILHVEFTRLNNKDDIFLKLSKQSLEGRFSSNVLIRVPEEFVLTVARQSFGASTWLKRVNSNQIPGFSSLMQSRFNQFFVWCELMHFAKSTEFLFDVYSPKNISLSGKNLKYQVKATLQAQMYAPKNGKYIPFMDFTIPFTSQVQMSLAQGKVFAKFSGVSLSLQEYWEPSYVEKYHPSETFDRSTISQRIQKSAEGATTSYALPKIPLADNLSMQIQKVQKFSPGPDVVFYLK